MQTIEEDAAVVEAENDTSNDNPLDSTLSGVVYGRSFRGNYASLHVARLPKNDSTVFVDPDDDAADPVLVRLQFPQEDRSVIRSYCRRFCKQGDWLELTVGTWQPINSEIDTGWQHPRLVVDLTSTDHAAQVLRRREIHYWTMRQWQAWQQVYQININPLTDGGKPPIWVDQPPPQAALQGALSNKPSNNGHGSALAKQAQGRFLTRFLVRMIMSKLSHETTPDPSTWATAEISKDDVRYHRALEHLNQGTGVLDVAGGSGLLSMALGFAVIDPRENVGRLPSRDRKAFKQAIRLRGTDDDKSNAADARIDVFDSAAKHRNAITSLDKLFYCQPVVQFDALRAWFGVPPVDVDTSFRHPDHDSLPVCNQDHDLLAQCRAIVALHPDEATDAIVDTAVSQRKPFLIVPCCVFFRFFVNRRKPNQGPVSTHEDLVEYLMAKDPSIQKTTLPFEGKNVVLWSVF
jgi:hypothetical protein